MPALGDGGKGGNSILDSGGTGGAGYNGASGGDGDWLSAGGGGGAGGGAGGDGTGLTPGSGGVGGIAGSPNGENGGDGFLPVSSGGGGGGGYNGNGAGAAIVVNNGALVGGNGGRGGDGGFLDGAGGGGGAGGYGAIVTGNAATSINLAGGTIAGGNGGRGGVGKDLIYQAGHGGDGGVGLLITSPGTTFINAGTIIGGNGGDAGRDILGAANGSPGAGGVGIVATGATVINAGTITGGLRGNGLTRANAITFAGGTNTLEIQAGSTITGTVSAFSAADTLRLGGAADASFNVSQIGPAAQYRGFGVFDKTGNSTWTLTGSTASVTSWTVNAGTLAITADNNLGAAGGGLALNGGTLQTSGVFALNPSRLVTLGAAGGTFNVASGSLGISSGIVGPGGLTKIGGGLLTLGGGSSYSGGTTVNDGTLALGAGASLNPSGALTVNGGAFDLGGNTQTVGNLSGAGGTIVLGAGTLTTHSSINTTLASVIVGSGGLGKQGSGILTLVGNNTYSGATTISGDAVQVGNGGASGSLGSGNVVNNGSLIFNRSDTFSVGNTIGGSGSLAMIGTGTMVLIGANSYSGGTTVTAGTVRGTTTSLQGNILNNASVVFDQASSGTYAGVMSGTGSLAVIGTGTVILAGTNSYTGGTTVLGGTLQGTTSSLQGNIVNNATVVFDQAGVGTYAGLMSGSGSLLANGTGTVILTGANSYTGGTTVTGGTLQGNTTSLQGNILNNASVVFNQTGSGTYAGAMSGTGSMTLQGGGVLNLTGTSTYTGPTTVAGGSTVYANGSLASTVVLNPNGILRGSGTIGGFESTGGILAPGNSIGTLTVTGNFAQTGGTYRVEANANGQNDFINVAGTATINGGTVQVLSTGGSYAPSTTYTILHANGGVSGSYSGLMEDFAFLTPSLAYDANNVFLTLALQGNAFGGFDGNTPNQRAVGYALDQSYANATGDFATVIGTLAGLNTQQGPLALSTISGEPWADFGTMNLASNALFMNALGQQMAMARNGQAGGQRVAMAQACDVSTCDDTSRFSAWISGLGGLGSVQGDGNASALTYDFGGAAAGIDYRIDPRFLVGIGVGYTHGTQWVNSFMGSGWTDAVSIAAYGSFTQGGFYADALAGYAYSSNQLQRQIAFSGLQQRTASGSAGANQFLGQVEFGYKVPVYAPASATVTPFARLQVMSVNQSAFSEWGANSLSLNVRQQTTNALRSVFGAELGGAIALSEGRNLALALRLGWQHEYAYTGRPITAAFAGAPATAFTVYGATPQRDAALIGFSAAAPVADNAAVYLRYDGDVGSGTDNHAFMAGLRLSW